MRTSERKRGAGYAECLKNHEDDMLYDSGYGSSERARMEFEACSTIIAK